jgi:hypothetical protein
LPTKQPANKLLAHELESCAVIESSKPEKSVVLERILANLSNRVKQGRLGRNDHKEASPTTDSPMNTIKSKQRVADHGEVFTPAWMVEAMLDLLKDFHWRTSSCNSMTSMQVEIVDYH